MELTTFWSAAQTQCYDFGSNAYIQILRRSMEGYVDCTAQCRARRLTDGSSDDRGRPFVEPRRKSMIGIKQFCFALANSCVAQALDSFEPFHNCCRFDFGILQWTCPIERVAFGLPTRASLNLIIG
jgi:hypothetical protein